MAFAGRSPTAHPLCDRPLLFVDDATGLTEVRRCRATRADKCVPCSESHRSTLKWLLRDGMERATHGRDEFASLYGFTLTAPGADVLDWDTSQCTHAPGLRCSGPLGCKVGLVDAAVWNASIAKRWNHFATILRRDLEPFVTVDYAKVSEPQKRDVLHMHGALRLSAPLPIGQVVSSVLRCAKAAGFGAQIDVQPCTTPEQIRRLAAYLSKYATKSVSGCSVPVLDFSTGALHERVRGYRTWSCSREWGLKVGDARLMKFAWWVAARSGPEGGGATPTGAVGALDPLSEISTHPPGLPPPSSSERG